MWTAIAIAAAGLLVYLVWKHKHPLGSGDKRPGANSTEPLRPSSCASPAAAAKRSPGCRVKKEATAPKEKQQMGPTSADPHWPALGDFGFEVVGESHYQGALKRLAGNHGTEPAAAQHVAQLVPETNNAHDPQAVCVRIMGNPVGYLSREEARSFRRRLSQKKLTGVITTCDAMVTGGGQWKGKTYSYGVVLDIKPFV